MEVMVMEVMEMELEIMMGMEMEDNLDGNYGDGVGDVDAEGDGGRLAWDQVHSSQLSDNNGDGDNVGLKLQRETLDMIWYSARKEKETKNHVLQHIVKFLCN